MVMRYTFRVPPIRERRNQRSRAAPSTHHGQTSRRETPDERHVGVRARGAHRGEQADG